LIAKCTIQNVPNFTNIFHPDYLFIASCLQRSENAASVKLEKGSVRIPDLCTTAEKSYNAMEKSLKSPDSNFIDEYQCDLLVRETCVR